MSKKVIHEFEWHINGGVTDKERPEFLSEIVSPEYTAAVKRAEKEKKKAEAEEE